MADFWWEFWWVLLATGIGFWIGWFTASKKHTVAGLTHVVCPHCGWLQPVHRSNKPCDACGGVL